MLKICVLNGVLAAACGCGKHDDDYSGIASQSAEVVQITAAKKHTTKNQAIKPVVHFIAGDSSYFSGGSLIKMNPTTRIDETRICKRKLAKHHRDTVRKAA